MTKKVASISLDLDNKWSYMKTHGDAGWETFPSYLDIVVPRILDILDKQELKITFFIVGQDAALEKNRDALASITAAGHEVGNHSFQHEPWLHLYSTEDIIKDLVAAENAIADATGQTPIGFRGPGYSLSTGVLGVLQERGYKYDCSTFPTFLGPLARAYYFMTTKLTPEEKEKRKKLFGTFDEGFRPLKPYNWTINGDTLFEIPVTTMPIFKIPIHISYILYAASISPALAMLYFRFALKLCKLTGVQPSILFHPLDFLSMDDAPELAFFPAMKMPLNKKLDVLNRAITLLKSEYHVVSMSQHVESLSSNLPSVVPEFRALQHI